MNNRNPTKNDLFINKAKVLYKVSAPKKEEVIKDFNAEHALLEQYRNKNLHGQYIKQCKEWITKNYNIIIAMLKDQKTPHFDDTLYHQMINKIYFEYSELLELFKKVNLKERPTIIDIVKTLPLM